MTTHANHHQPAGLSDQTRILSDYTPICDPDFDAGWEELERQFAEFRFTFDHN
jgi:hypothetical protein